MCILQKCDIIQALKDKVWHFKIILLTSVVFYMLKTRVWDNKIQKSWWVDNSATDPYTMVFDITS
jgi:hypothetical protein